MTSGWGNLQYSPQKVALRLSLGGRKDVAWDMSWESKKSQQKLNQSEDLVSGENPR